MFRSSCSSASGLLQQRGGMINRLVLPSLGSGSSSRRHFAVNTEGLEKVKTKDQIMEFAKAKPVVMFGKSTCSYCQKLDSALKGLDLAPPHKYIQLNRLSNGQFLQSLLSDVTGHRTVPSLFVGGKFVGGCSDALAALSSGELTDMLDKAGVKVGKEPTMQSSM